MYDVDNSQSAGIYSKGLGNESSDGRRSVEVGI